MSAPRSPVIIGTPAAVAAELAARAADGATAPVFVLEGDAPVRPRTEPRYLALDDAGRRAAARTIARGGDWWVR